MFIILEGIILIIRTIKIFKCSRLKSIPTYMKYIILNMQLYIVKLFKRKKIVKNN
jgi:hypothetical protein